MQVHQSSWAEARKTLSCPIIRTLVHSALTSRSISKSDFILYRFLLTRSRFADLGSMDQLSSALVPFSDGMLFLLRTRDRYPEADYAWQHCNDFTRPRSYFWLLCSRLSSSLHAAEISPQLISAKMLQNFQHRELLPDDITKELVPYWV